MKKKGLYVFTIFPLIVAFFYLLNLKQELKAIALSQSDYSTVWYSAILLNNYNKVWLAVTVAALLSSGITFYLMGDKKLWKKLFYSILIFITLIIIQLIFYKKFFMM